MKRILFLSKGEESSSTRYRALQFFDRLAAAGLVPLHLTIAGGVPNYLRALSAARAADVVVVLRKTFPALLLRLLRRQARQLVFDFDDAIFCNTDGSASHTRMSRFAAMVRAADHVLAGNGFLAQAAARFNPEVTLLPTCVDAARYRVAAEKPREHIDLVWIGSRSTRKYLEEMVPALRAAAQAVPGLRLKIVADFDLPHAGLETYAVPWSAAGEALALASSHIGIAPMRSDDWSRGKCALKVLQYMAAGLPVVSSNAGMNAEIVRPGENGFLADTDAQWREAIAALAADPGLRTRFGESGRGLVAERYSIDAVFEKLLATITAVARH